MGEFLGGGGRHHAHRVAAAVPYTDARLEDPEMNVARAWWEDIKSGKRTFSFKGQSVEYRFKPDGTWETLAIANPPDDGPGRREAGATDRPERRQVPEAATEQKPADRNPWPWIGGISAVCMGLLVWCLRRFRMAGSGG